MRETEPKYTLQDLQKELNDKQKMFALNWIHKWNGTQSYKDAYDITDDNTAAVNASKLLRNTKIIQYIDFIKPQYEENAGISKLSQLKSFIKIIEDEESNAREIIAALAEINKMMGYHEPDKVKHSGEILGQEPTIVVLNETGKKLNLGKYK